MLCFSSFFFLELHACWILFIYFNLNCILGAASFCPYNFNWFLKCALNIFTVVFTQDSHQDSLAKNLKASFSGEPEFVVHQMSFHSKCCME